MTDAEQKPGPAAKLGEEGGEPGETGLERDKGGGDDEKEETCDKLRVGGARVEEIDPAMEKAKTKADEAQDRSTAHASVDAMVAGFRADFGTDDKVFVLVDAMTSKPKVVIHLLDLADQVLGAKAKEDMERKAKARPRASTPRPISGRARGGKASFRASKRSRADSHLPAQPPINRR